ncbi:MAG: hypothetical protein LQ342_007159 [Letrouitia transgressa]|nr:MAG: hypothetical protein LQ342_007159 [Letrouitia transgressa]
MGKGTDKLYITHSEWASEDAYSASAGSGLSKANANGGAPFKRLPFKFCAISLQPFNHPVCTAEGTIFDITNILPWIKKHGTNPVSGAPLKSNELIKLRFAKNEDEEMVDPVTFKVFTDNTHIVALKNTGNVFAYDTVDRLNIKVKNWRDLVSEDEFSRKDIVVLQDPQNVGPRNLSSFKYLQDGAKTLTPEQQAEQDDHSRNVNRTALGNGAAVLKPKPRLRKQEPDINPDALASNRDSIASTLKSLQSSKDVSPPSATTSLDATKPSTTAHKSRHTTGQAAASLTSTGLTPHTSTSLATLTTEEYLLRPRLIKILGYARIETSHGPLGLELHPLYAPKAVWNFIQLAKSNYYNGLIFHRSIRNFMLQGGDPTGTGKGGKSCWGRNFQDEIEGPASHNARGVVSMANKGKNTNSSQFFITYRACTHLDRKHSIFGRVVDGLDTTLSAIENEETGEGGRTKRDVVMKEVVILVDPFEEFLDKERERDEREEKEREIRKKGGREEDRTTWTGKKVKGSEGPWEDEAGVGVGKYLKAVGAAGAVTNERDLENGGKVKEEEWEGTAFEPPKKKHAAGGFGNFDSW